MPGGNEAIHTQLFDNSFIINAIFMAIIPALLEELIFRGALLNSYIQTNKLRASILISALLFALFHFNLVQGVYTFVMGIIVGLIFVLTDSVLPCMLFHFVFNGISVINAAIMSSNTEEVSNLIAENNDSTTQMASIITIVLAVIGFIISIFIFKAIAKKGDSTEKLTLCIKGGSGEGKIITPPLIISLIFMASVTIITTILLYIKFT